MTGSRSLLQSDWAIAIDPARRDGRIVAESAEEFDDFQKRVDELAKNHRELDARIQELNWKTELVE